MIGLAAAPVSSNQAAPGLFLLAWGLFASVIGLGLVTNYRGFADKFTQSAYASSSWMRRVPPWKWMRRGPEEEELASRAKMNRLIGIPFAVLGPIVTVVAVGQILRGHIGVPRGPVLPLPFALAFIGVAVLAMVQYWRRGGFFWLAARQGGWMRAAAIVATLGAVSFGVFTALGLTTLGVAGWLVGGLASVYLMMSRRSAPVRLKDKAASSEADGPTPAQGRKSANSSEPGKEEDDGAAFRWL